MRFVRPVQVGASGNCMRVVEGCCAGVESEGVRKVCEGCEGCEGCAKGFDAGQGLLRVGAYGTRACLPRK